MSSCTSTSDSPTRCSWVDLDNPLYVSYHDEEWGKVHHDDNKHFEMLSLEGAQAGLSWVTILRKREHYRKVFEGFDPVLVAAFTDERLEELVQDKGIVRHRGKIQSVRNNARCFLKIQKEFGSFDEFAWSFVDNTRQENRWKTMAEYPSQTDESRAFSKELKRRGFSFVGPTTVYAYMQAAGLVNDHMASCEFG